MQVSWLATVEVRLIFILMLLFGTGLSAYVFLASAQSQDELNRTLERDAMEATNIYKGLFESSLLDMQKIALLISRNSRVQSAFWNGRQAVENEGGGAGEIQAAFFREVLHGTVVDAWTELTNGYGIRQLHFHLPINGDTSFLRVHNPDRFGDDLSELRHLIVEAIKSREVRVGFELGRVYSGIRAAVPVYSDDNRFTGVLEAGTSFDQLVTQYKKLTDLDIAIMVSEQRVLEAMWQTNPDRVLSECGCYVEAETLGVFGSSNSIPTNVTFLDQIGRFGNESGNGTFEFQGKTYSVAHIPVFDYIGLRDSSEAPVGIAVIWDDVTELRDRYDSSISEFIYRALAFFCVFSLAVFLGVRYSYSALNRVISEKTSALEKANKRLRTLADTDALTGVLSRRGLMKLLDLHCDTCQSSATPLSLLMLDIDHFKQVNDHYGHQTGDLVLQEFASIISRVKRNNDVVGRYGGEEFIIALHDSNLTQAAKVAERVRASVEAGLRVEPEGNSKITCSIGVSQLRDDDKAASLIARADQALYEAKESGRNRVVLKG